MPGAVVGREGAALVRSEGGEPGFSSTTSPCSAAAGAALVSSCTDMTLWDLADDATACREVDSNDVHWPVTRSCLAQAASAALLSGAVCELYSVDEAVGGETWTADVDSWGGSEGEAVRVRGCQ